MAAGKAKTNEYEQERARLATLFTESDEVKLALLDGLIDEAAKCRVELRQLSKKRDDLVERGAPFSTSVQVDNLIVKVRASYTNINEKLCRWLTTKDNENWEEGLEDYE